MVRLKQVLLPLLLVLVAVPVGFAQTTDLKPRPGPSAPTPTTRKGEAQGTPSRGRLSARVAVGERAPDFQLEEDTAHSRGVDRVMAKPFSFSDVESALRALYDSTGQRRVA